MHTYVCSHAKITVYLIKIGSVRSCIIEKLYKCYTSVSFVVPRVLVTTSVNGVLTVGVADRIMQDL